MQAHIEWYIDQQVLYVKRPEVMTLETLAEDSQRIIHFLENSDQPIHIINDTLAVKNMPKKLITLKRSVPFLDHPSLGWFLTLSDNPLINFFSTVLPQFRLFKRNQFYVMRTLGEAQEFLKKQVPTLDWTKVNPSIFASEIDNTLHTNRPHQQ